MSNITRLGNINFRNERKPFGIKDEDRLHHIYVIGKTGIGKSTLLLNMAISDLQRGNGLCLIDPHGDIAENILDYVPTERIHEVIYFNPSDETIAIGFNPLENNSEKEPYLLVSGLIATFKNIWIDSWGARLEYILRYSLLTLLEYPEATLLDIHPLLTNYEFRKMILSYCTDQYLLSFWYNEFDKYPPQFRAEVISPILNKAGLFSAIVKLRYIFGQTTSSFRIDEIMDQNKILICNLSKGKLGEDASRLLGSVIVNAIQLAAVQRASQAEEKRQPFYLYIDEMHSFVSLSIVDILAEARKYKLSLFLAHQYLEQVDERIRFAIFGNVGTMIVFRIGAEDAQQLIHEFQPYFDEEDLINLPRYSMYLKLMIDGATSKPFSAETEPIKHSQFSLKETIIGLSNTKYGKLHALVEQELWEQKRKVQYGFHGNDLFSS